MAPTVNIMKLLSPRATKGKGISFDGRNKLNKTASAKEAGATFHSEPR